MPLSKNDSKKIAIKAALSGDSKKASPVRVFDLCGRSSLADFVVLLTVESGPQLDAVEEEVQVRLKQDGAYCLYRDGMRSKNWKVLDYGGVLVHIFDGKAAEFYSIDKLYGDYKPVQWDDAAPAAKTPAAARTAVVKSAARKPAVKKTASVKKAAAVKKAGKKKAGKKKPARKPAPKKTPVRRPAAKKALPAKKNSRKK